MLQPLRRSEGYEVVLVNSNPVCCFEVFCTDDARVVCTRIPFVCSNKKAMLNNCTHNNNNTHTQATIMTDPGVADRTYVGPMTVDAVEEILIKVGIGLWVQYGCSVGSVWV